MAIRVHIPTPLRKLTDGRAEVSAEGVTVTELINNLEAAHTGIAEKLVDADGAVRRYVNLYVNDEDIRFLSGMDTPLKDGDSISIVPAIAGGC